MPLPGPRVLVRSAPAVLQPVARRAPAARWAAGRRPAGAAAVVAAASHPPGPGSGSGSSGRAGGLSGAAPVQHSFATRQQPPNQLGPGGPGNYCGGTCSTRALVLYGCALEYARCERWDVARRVFEKTVSECPDFVKPWVSWAQMEKRCFPRDDARRWANCRSVLQRGLLHNRDAPALLQAWGLMEMQRGNFLAAILLLDRSAQLEPRNAPVLRWKPVVEARQTVGSRRGHRLPTRG